ncbi:hypothetical protein NQ317_003521 [Molorchus minor]|uniref:Transforming acidic coiled-coil-containing protein C-terminal domain-containing protein n=1 Tax=Molorchus minor TaxID=1323400 RepID=A0ABQ9K1V6_9CUCU|nr:hypothetical protein NQ317_003521 [Molorchus minor]
MQEPVSKEEMISKNTEIGQYKEVVHEKDVILKNNKARIKELEEQISELEAKNRELEKQVKFNDMDDNEFQNIIKDYDQFINKIWLERKQLLDEISALKAHTDNLESSFANLLENYNKARTIITGLKSNEDILKNELDEYKNVIDRLEQKYNLLKSYSESKLAEANSEMYVRNKGNIQEVAKLKAKILQSEARINELRKQANLQEVASRPSVFTPLKSNIPKV